MVRNRYTKEFISDMKLKSSTCTLDDLLLIAIHKYKYNVTKDALRECLSKRGIKYLGYNTARVHAPSYPVGTEYTKEDGMTLIKVSKSKWMYKQRYLYEKYHNVKLTPRDYIIFVDGDRSNFDIDNLKKVDCRVASYIGNLRLACTDKDITDAAIAYANSTIQVKNLCGEKIVSHKRRCTNE